MPVEARNINFCFLLDGNGSAWFDAAKIEIEGAPYFSSEFDFDFESATLKGFPGVGNTSEYKVGIDKTTAFTGQRSLKMQLVAPEPAARSGDSGVKALDPGTVDDTSRSKDGSTAAPITFINRSSGPVDIYWIDYQGHRSLYRADLAVGASWRTGTFITHPWLVVLAGTGGTNDRDTGLRLAAFEASYSSGGDAVITDLH